MKTVAKDCFGEGSTRSGGTPNPSALRHSTFGFRYFPSSASSVQSVVIRGSLLSLPIRAHFRHGTNPSQGGRGYGRNGTKGLTYTLVYSKKYLT
jgi:hypothetical protein